MSALSLSPSSLSFYAVSVFSLPLTYAHLQCLRALRLQAFNKPQRISAIFSFITVQLFHGFEKGAYPENSHVFYIVLLI